VTFEYKRCMKFALLKDRASAAFPYIELSHVSTMYGTTKLQIG
jgi:hypothetical protein